MTAQIITRIKEFNDIVDKYHQIAVKEKASPDQIVAIQRYFEIPIPEDLKSLYLEMSGLASYDNESWSLQIDEVPFLLERLNHKDKWSQCRSLGLIDYIRFSWGNDRQELEEDVYLTGEQIDFLNKNYKCFGLYRTDWGFEEADYLYFDRNGKFGTIRYHQDYIHELVPRLMTLLQKSTATEDLDSLLLRIMNVLENGILSDND